MQPTSEWTDKDCAILDDLLLRMSGKYSINLLAILTLYGEKSFGDLKRDLAPISAKVLTDSLNQLVANGFIHNRKVTEGNVKRSYYTIADRDRFMPVLRALRAFATPLI